MSTLRLCFILLVLCCEVVAAQSSDPAYGALTRAFESQEAGKWEEAIAAFREAATISPMRADIRKNLAYVLLKIGNNNEARDEFGAAMKIDPADFNTALEYAFLCYEAREDSHARRAEARRVFARIRDAGDPASRATAMAAFNNIDNQLSVAIERLRIAIAAAPAVFSTRYELAQLAEERDDTELSATNYEAAFQLSPRRKSILLDLARVDASRGKPERSIAALIAASRGSEPRTAELARQQLPDRYPYVYEFRAALEIDPQNRELRSELAYLLLRMSENGQASRSDAKKEFELLGVEVPGEKANAFEPTLSPSAAREMGEKSYKAGYLSDALRYFQQAQAAQPHAATALRLGWTNNMLHQDAEAVRWFAIAAESDDADVAAEAKRAMKNLRAENSHFVTTAWTYPLYSSRRSDLFGYGQLKTEIRWKAPVRPYLSIRYSGDIRGTTGGPVPQELSDNAVVGAAGARAGLPLGINAWFEAGIAVGFRTGKRWNDYRGGLAWARTLGASLTGERNGRFLEINTDTAFMSHYGDDVLGVVRTRAGYSAGGSALRGQIFWNSDITVDTQRQYWANYGDMGPGIRIHPGWLPQSVWLDASALRGVYLRNEGNPGRPNFIDLRIGIWYAGTR